MTTRFLPALLAAAVLAACGSSSPDTSTPANDADNRQDTARAKLMQCLRDQGIQGKPRDADPEKLQAVLEGPCKRYAGDAFGTTDAGDPELQDQLTKLKACLREQGITTTPEIDRSDPKFDQALDACRDQVPQLR
jgi:hypothetical protein